MLKVVYGGHLFTFEKEDFFFARVNYVYKLDTIEVFFWKHPVVYGRYHKLQE